MCSGTYRWVPACLSQRSIPPGALRVGTDADGEEIYAGRAPHEGDILPAKVIPSKNACYVAHNGEEILKDQFEVNKIIIFILLPPYLSCCCPASNLSLARVLGTARYKV